MSGADVLSVQIWRVLVFGGRIVGCLFLGGKIGGVLAGVLRGQSYRVLSLRMLLSDADFKECFSYGCHFRRN